MNDVISDSRLASMLKKFLNKSDELKNKLPNIYHCGSRVIHQTGSVPAVFILKDANNSDKTKIYGNTSCHSAWACPKCTAQTMAKKGTDIACAIEALKKQNQSPFMVTFTTPHKIYTHCDDIFNILLASWRYFVRNGNKKGTLHKDRNTIRGNDPYGNFRETLEIRHHVKVFEFTWSPKNGWHPHIHMLFWTPDKNFSKLNDNWEELLSNRWWYCLKTAALKYYNKKNPNQEELNKILVEKLFADWKKNPISGHHCAFFSKDKDNKIRKIHSSLYISGWTGNTEMTKEEIKIGRGDQLTPFQILSKAYAETDETQKNYWLHLFTEYALATFKHRRCEFSSRSGINKIIEQWKKTQEYIEVYKKKVLDKEHVQWEVACWFKEQHWLLICWIEKTTKHEIITEILQRAPNLDDLNNYLKQFNVKAQPKNTHHLTNHLNQKVFNKSYKAS